MMNNLFSIFDPATSSMMSMNWCSLIMWIFIIPYMFWTTPSLFLISWKILFKKFFQEIKNNMISFKYKNIIIITSIFQIILFSNFFGLFPFVFTSSSHLVFSMYCSFPFWITFIIFSIFNKLNKLFSHLVPLGSPIVLSFFMVFIETVSNVIRPITLSVRLTANMISGHLLIHLLSSMMMSINFFFFVFLIMMILLILETAVAIIQSIVFVTLISLYLNEV
uniref:ATP synthase subunit a n=1 Tax=Amblyomma triguttatum TaxID=65637 RepID=Q6I7M8_9ACAR|nr:ATP synthase F0 subunit 6 [Amblyomma triguttatum]BAD24955.1 ATPase subunit 6 [Amblyomma triguttatum]